MAHSALAALRVYADLTKPRLLPARAADGLPVFGMAAQGAPSFGFAALVLLGIALAAASANTLNAYLERDMDALMERTRRPPAAGGAHRAARGARASASPSAWLSTLLLGARGRAGGRRGSASRASSSTSSSTRSG